MQKLHIHIGHHFFGSGNLGDDLMLAGFLAAARPARLEQFRLTCCVPHGADSQRLRFSEIEWLPYDEASRSAAVAECDVWLGLGDTPFQIVVGPWFLDHLVQEAAYCRRFRKPMYYLGVGVNEPEVAEEPKLRVLLGQAGKIWTRDAESAELLRRLTVPEKVVVGSDLAHVFLAGFDFGPADPESLAFLLNFENPEQFSVAQIDRLIQSADAREPAWLVQEMRSLLGSESALYQSLTDSARENLALRRPDYENSGTMADLLKGWGVPSRLFTSRYHGALLGAWMGCRTVAFARSAKLTSGARQLGIPLVRSLEDTKGILGTLESATPVPRLLLEAHAELANSVCDAFFSVAQTSVSVQTNENAARLASVHELESAAYTGFMARMNDFARTYGLRTFTDWSKIWEYPWLWTHGLGDIPWTGRRVVDLGSEISPMPWFLATLGARVTLIETDPQWVPRWEELRAKLGVEVNWHLVDSEILPLADGEADVLTSFSVIEHQPDKPRAMSEVARVLKPGGLLAISFDICEPDEGMTFPEWNGRALTLREFEEYVWQHPAFAAGPAPVWNWADVPDFRRWHLQSAPHHNYVVGAASLTRRPERMLPSSQSLE